jgi:hypothetical protein
VLRIERGPGRLVLVTRLARPRVLVILAGALLAGAVALRAFPPAAVPLAVVAALIVAIGGRSVRARFEGGRVRIRPAVPLGRGEDRPLADFSAAAVETVAQARRARADRLAEQYRGKSGLQIPTWLRPSDARGTNDHLRRVVLVPRQGEPVAVTAWLADDELEPLRAELEGMLR